MPAVKISVGKKPQATAAKPQKPQLPAGPQHGKSIIQRIVEIILNDIRHPDRIFETKKRVTMPESKESWKDWEGQI
jgi:hypothetical protein